jgi:prevent-host-death family protein
MKTIGAGKFKDVCLKTLDEVARTESAVVITKRGRPVARVVPCVPSPAGRALGWGSFLTRMPRGVAGEEVDPLW